MDVQGEQRAQDALGRDRGATSTGSGAQ
jgi:hypothetical protein